MVAAARRGVRRGAPRLIWGAILGVTGVFAAVMGPALVAGTGLGVALGWFVLGAGVVCAVVWGVGRVMLRPRLRATGPLGR